MIYKIDYLLEYIDLFHVTAYEIYFARKEKRITVHLKELYNNFNAFQSSVRLLY